jgi:predicted alpha/beta superfamily hydrolase
MLNSFSILYRNRCIGFGYDSRRPFRGDEMFQRRLFGVFLVLFTSLSQAQTLAPPIPERVVIHSKILNEDRALWIRMPAAAQGKKDKYPVAYLLDGGANVNEFGSTMDFLSDNNVMPPFIVVGIINTDRVRDLTPSRADVKNDDGTVDTYPTSGGADRFIDFIQKELAPEIDKRYDTQPYHLVVGHSLGGLFAIHALMNRPEFFQGCIATSPSLWWDDFTTLHKAEKFFPQQKDFKHSLFFVLGNEPGDMMKGFEGLQKVIAANRPARFSAASEHYKTEQHRTTELLGHYNGLRFIFTGWPPPRDPDTDRLTLGLEGLEKHYRDLSDRFGFPVSAEKGINSLGYSLLGNKKTEEALAAFQRNAELYPDSANVYDSLADAQEAAGKKDLAIQNVRKAVDLGTKHGDPELAAFKRHLQKLEAKK